MPQQAWSAKRERQYKDIKKSELDRGRSEKRAEEIAAATVNKTRAEHGETNAEHGETKSSTSSGSGSKRGGQRAQGSGKTRDELYDEARRRNIDGRSKMNKQELANALGRS
ncbi:plasmid stabilization protein [Nocardia sp. NPDC058658]|uniref:plasmid stabilization protein n=1 Tax=Nocardia sp. NPDC058658 TaxID=3346580 RepID=UPI0036605B50